MSTDCYKIIDFKLNPGTFEDTIDRIYILTMEDSDRHEKIMEQVIKANICSNVSVQVNKGYKKCHKNLKARLPNHDLCHASKNVHKDAISRNCKRILHIEDDCEFNDRIHDPVVISEIKDFLQRNDPKIYSLGTVVSIINPIDILANQSHQRLIFNTCTHAIIFNREMSEMISDPSYNFMPDHIDLDTTRHYDKFTYKYPIAYQRWAETENSKVWDKFDIIKNVIVKPFGLDTENIELGIDKINAFFRTISVIIFILILFLAYLKLSRK